MLSIDQHITVIKNRIIAQIVTVVKARICYTIILVCVICAIVFVDGSGGSDSVWAIISL